ncbi:hypothetical protein SAMN05421636_1273 [Pricia antarctica]|uniref:Uncharacterized protein n=1 Tax=Pricia antarctica TaxID=641691 RepID=A0A1G7JH14_9FLAO|nr:hypothetical protein [Pricia antarctica]SDF24074.1 hypothetical protein SAMN05421636_1273 [Pricia antarctica]
MENSLGNPWDFGNEFYSPNGEFKLYYGVTIEIAMGAPIYGECYFENRNKTFMLKDSYGGPIVWNSESTNAAIPYWTNDRKQKLAIIDTVGMKVLLSKTTFRVIQLEKIENDIIYGIDSPAYQPKRFKFDLEINELQSFAEIK